MHSAGPCRIQAGVSNPAAVTTAITHLDYTCTAHPLRHSRILPVLRPAGDTSRNDLDKVDTPFPALQPTLVRARYQVCVCVDVLGPLSTFLSAILGTKSKLESRIVQVAPEEWAAAERMGEG